MNSKKSVLGARIVGWFIIIVSCPLYFLIDNTTNEMFSHVFLTIFFVALCLLIVLGMYVGLYKGEPQHVSHYANIDTWFVLKFFDKKGHELGFNIYAYEKGLSYEQKNISCWGTDCLVNEVKRGQKFIIVYVDGVYYLKPYIPIEITLNYETPKRVHNDVKLKC